MKRHIHGPALELCMRYRQAQPIVPDRVVPVGLDSWVSHYQGMGAMFKRKSSGTFWAVDVRGEQPPPIRSRARQSG